VTTTNFTVRDSKSAVIANCAFARDAAAVVTLYDNGAFVTYGLGLVVWTEGEDGIAGRDLDASAATMLGRVDAELRKLRAALQRL
jgi:hypothetical protein